MESCSLSSSSASSVPSVLENSDYDEKQVKSDEETSDNYDEEDFESSGESEPTVAASNSSSSDKYGSDVFEDEHDNSVEAEDTEGGDDGYECDSFEREDEESSKHEPEHEKQTAEDDEEVRPTNDRNINPQLGTWCSKKIQDLKEPATKVESQNQCDRRSPNNLSATAVEKLMHRARASQRVHRSRSNQNISTRQRPKVPTSLMQRAQTQLWVAKSSTQKTNTTMCQPDTLRTETPTTRSVAPTFCSVKRENLLGRLATMQFEEISNRWAVSESGGVSLATLEFVRNMAAKQREVHNLSDSTDKPGGKMLHRVAMTAQLQLEDSIALRHQADELLGRVKEI